jgi:hypothetical protein
VTAAPIDLDAAAPAKPRRRFRTTIIKAGRWKFRIKVRIGAVPPTPAEAQVIADQIVAALSAGDT